MPPIESTFGKLSIAAALPEGLKYEGQVLDKKGTAELYAKLADIGGDAYRIHAKKLQDVAAEAAADSGGYSVSLENLIPSQRLRAVRDSLQQQLNRVISDPSLTPDARDKAISETVDKFRPVFDAAVTQESEEYGGPLTKQFKSGAKGSKDNYASLVAGDLLYADPNFKNIPYPVLRGYAEGLQPHQYFAGAFGARQGLALLKLGTAAGGYAAKRLLNAAHRLRVTAHDSDKEPEQLRGLPVDVSDPDNEGALLAAPAGGFPRNTVLTYNVLNKLQSMGLKNIVVRSPTVGGPADGGVYARDVGVRDYGNIASVNENVGVQAAGAVSEPMTQTMICLAEGTRVRMADWTTKAIEEVSVGDYVLGADISGRTFPVRVLNVFDNGLRECVNTTFRFGKRSASAVLTSTVEHKVLAVTRMSSCKEAEFNGINRQLPVGKRCKSFFAANTGRFDDSGLHGERRALLLGLLLGDGCYTAGVRFDPHLSCADPTLVHDLKDYLSGLNLKLVRQQASNGIQYRLSQVEQNKQDRDAFTGRLEPGFINPAKEMLQSMGALGLFSYQKRIPNSACSWDNASVAMLLSGLFVSDGSVFRPEDGNLPLVSFASTSKHMASSIKGLLEWRFGIVGTMHKNISGRNRPLFSVLVSKYVDVKKLRSVMSLYGVKRFTYDKLLSEAERYAESAPEFASRRMRTPARMKRVSQTTAGRLATFDLEVDHPDHLFVLANGLIVSNSSKHGGGVSGSSKGQEGFPIMDRLISIPSVYSGGAAYAQRDGKVTAVTQAPQGGTFIDVTGPDGQVTKHYADQDRSVLRKVGDAVEAGDELTDGLTNPAEVVTHRGIGEGRRRFIEAFRSAAQSAGFKPSRRNLEIIATGLINHVRLNTEVGDYSPDEVVPYSVVEHNYKPREGASVGKPSSMVGKYLESPVLHHTIGTRITNRVASELAEHGIDKVTAHTEKPPFDAVMIRSHDTASIDPDWGVRFLGTHLQKNILQAAHTGRYTDTAGSSFVPALMAGGTALKAPNRGATGAGQSSPKPTQPNQENSGPVPKPGGP